MKISVENAQRIVSEISSVLGEDVNLMDRSAVIMASTDPNRIGNHHLGAERVITEQLDRLIIEPHDRLPGVRPGLNLPIWVEGEITGVLGITGDPATFTTPAHVLQKMTEILLRETHVRERAERHGRSYSRFLEAWLTDAREPTPEIVTEGNDFNIDVRAAYVVATARVTSAGSPTKPAASSSFQAEVDRMSELVLEEARARGAITALLASRIVILIPHAVLDKNPMGSRDSSAYSQSSEQLAMIVSWLDHLARRVRAESTLRLAVGLSGIGLRGPQATDQAEKALSHALHSPTDIHRYDGLTIELLLSATPARERQAFVLRVFEGLPAEHRDELIRSLRSYFDADGSLSRAADILFIHKNTLTGRLNRIADSTGLDPRRIADAAILWLALQFTP